MTSAVLLNLILAAVVLVAIVGLLAHSIRTERLLASASDGILGASDRRLGHA